MTSCSLVELCAMTITVNVRRGQVVDSDHHQEGERQHGDQRQTQWFVSLLPLHSWRQKLLYKEDRLTYHKQSDAEWQCPSSW